MAVQYLIWGVGIILQMSPGDADTAQAAREMRDRWTVGCDRAVQVSSPLPIRKQFTRIHPTLRMFELVNNNAD